MAKKIARVFANLQTGSYVNNMTGRDWDTVLFCCKDDRFCSVLEIHLSIRI